MNFATHWLIELTNQLVIMILNNKQEKTMKKSEAISKIMDLKGVQKVQTIIDIIMSIENFKKDTLNKLTPTDDYS